MLGRLKIFALAETTSIPFVNKIIVNSLLKNEINFSTFYTYLYIYKFLYIFKKWKNLKYKIIKY